MLRDEEAPSMKRAAAIGGIAIIMIICTNVAAQTIDFRGIRPHLAKENTKTFSISIPIIPYAGFRDVKSFGKIPRFSRALESFNIPRNDIRSLPELVEDVNNLVKSKFSLNGVVLPQVGINFNSKSFEFSFRGGVVNLTKGEVLNLEKELDFFQIYYNQDGSSYLRTDRQKVLHIKALTLAGGEFWGTAKIPVKISRYRLRFLLGIGGMAGYLHTHQYTVRLAQKFSTFHMFDHETIKMGRSIGQLGLRMGFQLDGYKYLRPRVIVEAMGLVGHDHTHPPTISLGLSVRIWKLFTFSSSVLNFADPEVKVEISRDFHKNSEVALGGVFKSKSFKSDFGYLTLALGGKLVKLTSTMLVEKSRVGLLFGVNLGYRP